MFICVEQGAGVSVENYLTDEIPVIVAHRDVLTTKVISL